MEKLIEIAIKASIEAGKAIMEIYDTDFDIAYKKDHSPLTTAD
ncbi:MAG: 3'(2'),5'-bisphosphate nucleotidase CysQ, partial [Marinilabiliales bacterium]